MNVAHLCVLIAAALPYAFVGYAKSEGRYLREGNRDPRAYAEALAGARKRAYNAHLNGFEAFPAFAAAVLLAEHAGAAQERVDLLALVFVAARVAYGLLYIADRASLRSLVWSLGMAVVVALFVMAI